MRRSGGTPALRSTMPFCTSIAQRTASTTLRNSMRLPSRGAVIVHHQIEPPLDLPVGLLRETDRARRANAFEPRGDIDAVTHQIAICFLDDVAEMNADPEFNPTPFRQPRIALNHAVLHFDGAANGLDHAAKLDEKAISGSLDDAAMVGGDGGVDKVAAQPPKARERAILVRARKPAVADNVGDQNGGNLAALGHGALSAVQT